MSSVFKLPRYVRRPVLILFLLPTAISLLVLASYFRLQPQVPIFYSLPRKAQHLAAKEWLFLWPAISFTVSLLHLFLLRFIRTSEQLLTKLFIWTTIGLQILLAVALVRIVLIIS